jgi:hypothetical protein
MSNKRIKDIEYIKDILFIYSKKYKFILQQTTLISGEIYLINARTSEYSIIKKDIRYNIKHKSTIKNIIQHSINTNIYRSDIELDDIQYSTYVTDPNLKDFLDSLNPQIILPVIPNIPRYFTHILEETNEQCPELLILSLINNKWQFFESYTGIEFNPFVQSCKYVEKTFDEINKESKRLQAIVLPEITNISGFTLYYEKLLNIDLIYNTKYYTSNDILDIINNEYGRHLSFSIPLFETAIKSTNITKSNSSVIINSIPEIDSSIFNTDYFKVISFLRNYVDLYHDILTYGHKYCKELRKRFEKTVLTHLDSYSKDFYWNNITKVDKYIFTSTNNINNTKCKEIVEFLADTFIQELHNYGKIVIPKTKENAFVISASIDNSDEIDKLVNILKEDGITGFFVESANNNIGEILVKKGFQVYDLTIGEWDAGSGFTAKKMRGTTVEKIGPNGIIKIPNQEINMFGFINTQVSDDNKILTVTTPSLKFYINGPAKISANTVIKTTDNDIIRGSEEKDIGILTTNPPINTKSTTDVKSALASLKTWTDLIQIISISKIPKNIPKKILTVIYDGICETTSRLYGLGNVLKTEGKIVTYYSYNLNARKISPDNLKSKLKLRGFIYNNIDLIKNYLNSWFDQKINGLKTIYDHFYDPIFYFVSKLFIEKYSFAKQKALELLSNINTTDIKVIPYSINEYIESISNSTTLLSNFLNYVAKFNTAINSISALSSRSTSDDFLNAYSFLKQQIIDTFGNSSEDELRAMTASTIAYAFFLKLRDYTLLYTLLDTIKSKIIKNVNIAEKLIIKKNMDGNINIDDFETQYLPTIRDLGKIELRNIADIEIAYQIIISLPPLINNNGEIMRDTDESIIDYKYYIKQISERPVISSLPSYYSFKYYTNLVKDKINFYTLKRYYNFELAKIVNNTTKENYKQKKTNLDLDRIFFNTNANYNFGTRGRLNKTSKRTINKRQTYKKH